jgi:hypothetical protein
VIILWNPKNEKKVGHNPLCRTGAGPVEAGWPAGWKRLAGQMLNGVGWAMCYCSIMEKKIGVGKNLFPCSCSPWTSLGARSGRGTRLRKRGGVSPAGTGGVGSTTG